jgi:hypothetical protein
MYHAPKLKKPFWIHRWDCFQEHLLHTFEALALADRRVTGSRAVEDKKFNAKYCPLCHTDSDDSENLVSD